MAQMDDDDFFGSSLAGLSQAWFLINAEGEEKEGEQQEVLVVIERLWLIPLPHPSLAGNRGCGTSKREKEAAGGCWSRKEKPRKQNPESGSGCASRYCLWDCGFSPLFNRG